MFDGGKMREPPPSRDYYKRVTNAAEDRADWIPKQLGNGRTSWPRFAFRAYPEPHRFAVLHGVGRFAPSRAG